MNRRVLPAVAVIVALASVALPLVHGFGFMAGFNSTPPAELSARVTAAAPTSRHGRVVVVVVDGMRSDRLALLGLDAIVGARAMCSLTTVLPSFSRPAYVALSTGVPPTLSGVHTNDHEGPARLESVWDVARRAGRPTRLAADGTDWWLALFPDAFARSLVVPKERFASAFEAERIDDDELLLLHLVAADDEGHDFGVHAAYDEAVREAGALIVRLAGRLDLARDTLLVTADHGHIDRGGHGGPEPEVMTVPLVAIGHGVRRIDRCEGSVVDLAATIAALVGVPPPAANTGDVLPIVAFDDGATSLASAFDAPSVPLARAGSLLGVSFALVFMALAFALALTLVRRASHAISLGRALVVSLASPALAVATYAVLEPTLSLSAVWLEDPWTLRMIAVLGVPSLVAVVLAARVAPRSDPFARLLLAAIGAVVPLSLAAGLHGGFVAGPELGEPHAAFALIVSDLIAALGAFAAFVTALLTVLLRLLSSRRRSRAAGAPAASVS